MQYLGSACVGDVDSWPLGFIFSEASPAALSFDLATCGASFFLSLRRSRLIWLAARSLSLSLFFLLFLRGSLVALWLVAVDFLFASAICACMAICAHALPDLVLVLSLVSWRCWPVTRI
jgi:hypothetical protein